MPCDERHRQRHQDELPPAHAGGEQHGGTEDRGDHRRAEIGLLHDQRDRHQHRDDRHDQEQRIADPLPRRAVEPRRQRQHQRDLHQFRRLDLQAAQVDPALRALAGMAVAHHQHQQHQRDQITRPGQPRDEADIDQRDADHQHQAGGEAQHMARGVRLRRTARGAEQRDVADAGQRAEQRHIQPVHLPDLGAEIERGLAPQPPFPHFVASRWATCAPGSSSRPPGSRCSTSIMMSRAIGAAAAAPALPCSTTTDSA